MTSADFYINNYLVAKPGEICFKPSIEYVWEDLFHGNINVSDPLPVTIEAGTILYDIVRYYGDGINFAISAVLKKSFEEKGITGWTSYPLKIDGRNEEYYGFRPVSKCGPVKRLASLTEMTGFEFDISTWDGSDIFVPENVNYVFWTKRAVDVIKSLKIKNVDFISSKKKRWYS